MSFVDVISSIDSFVWGTFMIVILLGTHVFMTIRTGFIQRKIGTGIKLSVTKDPDAKGDISQFGALTTALAATIGTGNIVGVATALISGGPGALLWMWLTGVFGIATKYSESYISVKYRVKDHNGNMLGGAMYALERGFKHKGLGRALAITFALLAAIASFGIGSAVQANSLASAIVSVTPEDAALMTPVTLFGIETTWLQIIIGVIVVILVGIVIFGGIKVISNVCEKLVPFMSIFYVIGCIIIICLNGQYLGEALALICTCAFTPRAAFGGAAGTAVSVALQMGCARGLFSNESGMGSAPLVAASATTRNPARQALVSMTGTFWDTVVVCALTGLALVTGILGNPDITSTFVAGGFVKNAASLTTSVFAEIPVAGPMILCIGLVCFTYSTILGWSYYGNRCITYLFGKNAITPYQIVYVIVAFLGAIGVSGFVWDISDITNALMALPNIVAVLGLSGVIWTGTKHYVYNKNLMEIDDTEIPIVMTK
jgi:AGCS family alanine or glycine:cation symporter